MNRESTALVIVDAQQGFDDPRWGRRNNPSCEDNLRALVGAWRAIGAPLVLVQHSSLDPNSPLAPNQPGHALKPCVEGPADLHVTKSVHSAFRGDPDLAAWFRERKIQTVAIAGITTDYCCETTARDAAEMGYRVLFIGDATHTFDRKTPAGQVVTG